MEKERQGNASEIISMLSGVCSIERNYGSSLRELAAIKMQKIPKE